jgi:hypothetical protein
MPTARRLLYVLATLAALWLVVSADLPAMPIPGWPHG